MHVLVDLDGVIFDYCSAITNFFHEESDIPLAELPMPDRWAIWDCWQMRKDDWIANATAAADSGLFAEERAYPDAIEGVRELNDLGHKVHIATARRGHRARIDTLEWLKQHNVDYDRITFTTDKSVIKADVAIEDNLDNAAALQAAGVTVFLMDRPWNQEPTDIPRVSDMRDFVIQVQELEFHHLEGKRAPLNGEHRETSHTGGQKGQKAEQFSLLPPRALMEVARVYAFGAAKYDRDNWQRGYPYHLSMDAHQRHTQLYWSGESYDQESGLHHMAHAVFHALALIYFDGDLDRYAEFDDRNPY